MKILFLVNKTGPNGYYHKMSRVRFHGMESVAEISDLSWWGPGWDGYDNTISVSENLEKLDTLPDLIVTYKPLDMIGMKDVDIPVCLRYNEMYDFGWTTEEIDKSGAEFVICHHENDMEPYIQHYGDKVKFVHIPHCGKKEVFKDWGEEKIYDFMIGGAVGVNTAVTGQHYPLRDRMVGILRRLGEMGYKVYQHPHPGYTHDDAYTNKYLIDFSKAINRAKICITCSGAPKSRFGKYIEIPMSGTAIAGDIPGQDEQDFRKFVIELTMDMSDEEIINKLVGYIKDEAALKKVTQRGLEWSKGYTQEYYAKRFVEEAKHYLSIDEEVVKVFNELGEIDNFNVEDNYRDIWKEISYEVQNWKADNVGLSQKDRDIIFEGLMKRPSYLVKLANIIGAKNIVEVGTAEGLQFFTFAEGLSQSNKNGKVWSCDILDKRNLKYKDYFTNTEFCLGTSKALSTQIPNGTLIDLFYIDAAHDTGDVLQDVENLRKFQHENTYWVFDDFDERFGCYDDISKFMSKNKNYKVYHVGNTASNAPNHQVIIKGII